MGLAEIILVLLLQDDPDTLVARLRSDDPERREEATDALKQLGPAARDALARVKDDPDPEVAGRARFLLRRVDVAALVNDRLRAAVSTLEDRLASNDEAWCDVAAEVAKKVATQTAFLLRDDLRLLVHHALRSTAPVKSRLALLNLPELRNHKFLADDFADLLPAAPPELHEPLLRHLQNFDAARHAPAIVPFLKSESPLLRRSACNALSRLLYRKAAADVAALLEDPDPGVVDTALQALRNLGPRGHEAPLMKLLADPRTAGRAASALYDLDLRDHLPKLRDLMAHESDAVATNALRLALRARDETVADDVAKLLQHANTNVRRSAAEALALTYPARAAPALFEALNDGDASVRSHAVRGLSAAAFTDPAIQTRLADLVGENDMGVRLAALAALRAADAADKIAPLLDDPQPAVRIQAANALAALKGRDALPFVEPLLKDNDTYVRQEVLGLFLRVSDDADRCVRLFADAFADANRDVQNAAANRLRAYVSVANAHRFVPFLKHESETVRRPAMDALASTPTRAALAEVLKLLDAPELFARESALRLLADWRPPGAAPDIIKRLKDEAPSVRSRAVSALAGTDDVVPMLSDPDAAVRESALLALGGLQAPAAAALLADPEPAVRRSALHALGEARIVDALAAVRERLKDDDPDVRAQAALTLKQLGAPADAAPLLSDPDENVRVAAVECGAASPAERINALSDPSYRLRAAAVALLDPKDVARLTDDFNQSIRLAAARKAPADRLRPLLSDSYPGVRAVAFNRLLALEGRKALADIVPFLFDKDTSARLYARNVLVNWRAAELAPAVAADPSAWTAEALDAYATLAGKAGLTKVIDDVPAHLRDDVLRRVDDPAVAARFLDHPNPELRRAAVDALLDLRSTAHAAAVAGLVGDPDGGVRRAAFIAALALGADVPDPLERSVDARPWIAEAALKGDNPASLLSHEDAAVRASALRRLAELKFKDPAPIVALLDDPAESVRAAALAALPALDAPAVAKVLASDSRVVAEAAVAAFARFDRPADILPALDHVNPRVRASAADALCRAGMKDGAAPLLELFEAGRANPFALNALRQPDLWARLKSQSFDTPLPELPSLASDPDAPLRWHEDLAIPPAATVLEALDALSRRVDVILEPDKIRLVSRDAASSLWTKWWAEEKARK